MVIKNTNYTKQEIERILEAANDIGLTISQEKLLEICSLPDISKSKRQAREDIQNGAIFINGEKCTDLNKTISNDEKLYNKYTIIRRGKKNYSLILWG